MDMAHQNDYYDVDIEQSSKNLLLKKLDDDIFDSSHTKHAVNHGYFNKNVMTASGIRDITHILHAFRRGFR
jgi:hypothetical protein